MAELIVGNKDCSIAKVVDTIMSSPGSDELFDNWTVISTALETPGMKKQKLQKNLRMDMITIDAALETILTEWRSRKAKKATLLALVDVLKAKSLNQIAENLEQVFFTEDAVDGVECSGAAAPTTLHFSKIQYVPPPSSSSCSSPEEPTGNFWINYLKEKQELCCLEEPEDFSMRMVGEYCDVKVVKPKEPMNFCDDHYRLPTGFKGYALILNVIEYEDPRNSRGGARHDSHNMTTLWNQLGYKVIMYDDGMFTAERVRKIINDFKRKLEEEKELISSIVVFIGSHGEFSRVQWSDLSELNLYTDIVFKFNAENCPALIGRPKIFIVSTCQGFESDACRKPASDRKENNCKQQLLDMKPIDDTVVCLGSLPGYFAYRHQWLGSVFGYSLTKVFERNAHQTDLLKMLSMTEEKMRQTNVEMFGTAQEQMPNYQVMGMKTLYFNLRPVTSTEEENY